MSFCQQCLVHTPEMHGRLKVHLCVLCRMDAPPWTSQKKRDMRELQQCCVAREQRSRASCDSATGLASQGSGHRLWRLYTIWYHKGLDTDVPPIPLSVESGDSSQCKHPVHKMHFPLFSPVFSKFYSKPLSSHLQALNAVYLYSSHRLWLFFSSSDLCRMYFILTRLADILNV